MNRKQWIKAGRLLVAVYLGIILMLMAIERFLVYPAPPANEGSWVASEFGAEEATFRSADGTQLHGWYFQHPAPRAHLLFCHGNGEHVGYMGSEMLSLRQKLDASIFVFDYRGYGRSQGKPFEEGVLQDAEAAHRWLAEQASVDMSEVVLYGRSLGGGVAVHLAGSSGARALVLERTFHSMVDIGAELYPWLPVRWVMRNRYPSSERIRKYDGPLLQLHGIEDSLVPIESAKKLFDASPSVKKSFIEAADMGHNDPTPAKFYTELDRLFDSL